MVNDDTRDIAHQTHVGQMALLYETAFNRVPDDGGLNAYDDALDTGITLNVIAQTFVASPEFAARYPDATQADIITSFYQNVLERAPEPGAIEYWSQFTLADALVGISQSREAQIVQDDGLDGYQNAVMMDTTGGGMGELDAYAEQPQVVEVPVDRPVPGPTVIVDDPDITTTSHTRLDAQFLNANGNLFQGDGTTPADGFTTTNDPGNGLTFGVEITPRQTDTAFGGTTSGYLPVDGSFDGTIHRVTYAVPSGPQDTDNGSFQDLATRGAVNSNVVIDLDDDAMNFADFLAEGNVLELRLDTDASSGVAHATFQAVVDPATGSLDFVNAQGQGFRDFRGNDQVASESLQQNFVTPGGVADLDEGALFSNALYAYDAEGAMTSGLEWNLQLVQPGYSPQDQFI